MGDRFTLIAGLASILGFLIGVATTRWGREALTDLTRSLRVPFLGVRLVRVGVYDFFDSRAALSRQKKTTSIVEYLRPATKELGIIALSLNFSIIFQHLHDQLRTFLKTRPELHIYLFLLQPESPILETVATASGRTGQELKHFIQQSWERLNRMAASLDPSERARLHLRMYDTYVANSILVVDPYELNGRILVENYLYKTPIDSRYSFECRRPGSVMYDKVRLAYEHFKEDFPDAA